MKLQTSLILLVILFLISCTSSPEKNTGIEFNKPFMIDSIEYNLFDIKEMYACFSVNKIASKEDLQKVIDSATFLKDRIIYFHLDKYKDRGQDFATYINDDIILNEHPITNDVEMHIKDCQETIWMIESQLEALEFYKDYRKVVVDITKTDLKNLGAKISKASSLINDLNKELYKEDFAKLNVTKSKYKILKNKLDKIKVID